MWCVIKREKTASLIQTFPLRKTVFYYLSKNWSPEQIAKRLIILYPNDMNMRISHEAIYSYLYILPRGRLKRQIVSHLTKTP